MHRRAVDQPESSERHDDFWASRVLVPEAPHRCARSRPRCTQRSASSDGRCQVLLWRSRVRGVDVNAIVASTKSAAHTTPVDLVLCEMKLVSSCDAVNSRRAPDLVQGFRCWHRRLPPARESIGGSERKLWHFGRDAQPACLCRLSLRFRGSPDTELRCTDSVSTQPANLEAYSTMCVRRGEAAARSASGGFGGVGRVPRGEVAEALIVREHLHDGLLHAEARHQSFDLELLVP